MQSSPIGDSSNHNFAELKALWENMLEPMTRMLQVVAPQVFWASGTKAEFPEASFGAAVGRAAVWYALVGEQIERREQLESKISVGYFRATDPRAQFLRDFCLTALRGASTVGLNIPREDWVRIIVAGAVSINGDMRLRRVRVADEGILVVVQVRSVSSVLFTDQLLDALEQDSDAAWRAVVSDFDNAAEIDGDRGVSALTES